MSHRPQEPRIPTRRMHFTKSDVSDPVTSGKTLRDASDLLKKLDIAGLEARQMLFKNLGSEYDSEEIHHIIARIFPGSRPTDKIYIKALKKVTRVFNDCRKQTLTAADDFLDKPCVEALKHITNFRRFLDRVSTFTNKKNVAKIFP